LEKIPKEWLLKDVVYTKGQMPSWQYHSLPYTNYFKSYKNISTNRNIMTKILYNLHQHLNSQNYYWPFDSTTIDVRCSVQIHSQHFATMKVELHQCSTTFLHPQNTLICQRHLTTHHKMSPHKNGVRKCTWP
jgi:hypothetical protein